MDLKEYIDQIEKDADQWIDENIEHYISDKRSDKIALDCREDLNTEYFEMQNATIEN